MNKRPLSGAAKTPAEVAPEPVPAKESHEEYLKRTFTMKEEKPEIKIKGWAAGSKGESEFLLGETPESTMFAKGNLSVLLASIPGLRKAMLKLIKEA